MLAPHERPIVLIVDDSPDSVLLLTETLKDKYRTKIATSAALAMKSALRHPQPDIILMDVVMPEMDGFELCKSFKSLADAPDIPIIFITGKIQPEEEAHGLAIGAVDYITKPISAPVVLARIATHLVYELARRNGRYAVEAVSTATRSSCSRATSGRFASRADIA